MARAASSPLPGKPSELILLALDDFEKAEGSPLYDPDMNHWHDPREKCSVCFAGAVMAFSLNEDPKHVIHPSNYPEATRWALFALNNFREGNILGALRYLRTPQAKDVEASAALALDRRGRMPISPYERSRSDFKRDMRAVATKLASIGL